MADAFTPADLQLFVDLDRASRAVGVAPCLIGAGAIQVGPALGWEVRSSRMTHDWDFAVRVESWRRFGELGAALTGDAGGFTGSPEPHRFVHRLGGRLDVVPYGSLEDPQGTLRWPDGTEMDAAGLDVLDAHYQPAPAPGDSTKLRVATLPALVGLKLLAYRSRRPVIVRDIVDFVGILRDV